MLESILNRRVVLAGGPSTGKTSVLNELKKLILKQEIFYVKTILYSLIGEYMKLLHI